jgi:hypothetical protein
MNSDIARYIQNVPSQRFKSAKIKIGQLKPITTPSFVRGDMGGPIEPYFRNSKEETGACLL